jgi:hypothetical protein
VVVQIAADPSGHLIALRRDGSIARQVRVDGLSGTYPVRWEPVPLGGIDGRIVQIAVRFDGTLAAVTGAGAVFEQFREYGDPSGAYRWRRVPEEG